MLPLLACGCIPNLSTLWKITPVFGHVHVLKNLPPAAQTPALAGLTNSVLPPWPRSSADALGCQEMSDSTAVLGQWDEKQESDPIRDCLNAPSCCPLLPMGNRIWARKGVCWSYWVCISCSQRRIAACSERPERRMRKWEVGVGGGRCR